MWVIKIFVSKWFKDIFCRQIEQDDLHQAYHKQIIAPQLAQLFIDAVLLNHKLVKVLIFDRDNHFTSLFWKMQLIFF